MMPAAAAASAYAAQADVAVFGLPLANGGTPMASGSVRSSVDLRVPGSDHHVVPQFCQGCGDGPAGRARAHDSDFHGVLVSAVAG